MPVNLENSGVSSGLEKVSFPSKTKDCSKYWTVALLSHASKVMVKILQARLQQNMNRELPDIQAGFRKGRETRDQIANICWRTKKRRVLRKTSISALLTMPKVLTVWINHNKLWKILQEIGIPDHLTCLLRNLYAGQEATVRTGYGTTDWFQIGKEYIKAVFCHPAYLIYMQSTSCEMLGWMNHKLDQDCGEKYQ